MKRINAKATKAFIALLKRLEDGLEHQINPPDFGLLPLTIERNEKGIHTPLGEATIFTLYHHKGMGLRVHECNMRFLVIDNRQYEGDIEGLAVIPYAFRSDETGEETESITIENRNAGHIIKLWQAGHVNQANEWLQTIRKQGYLKQSGSAAGAKGARFKNASIK
jgi:hypothetical protein